MPRALEAATWCTKSSRKVANPSDNQASVQSLNYQDQMWLFNLQVNVFFSSVIGPSKQFSCLFYLIMLDLDLDLFMINKINGITKKSRNIVLYKCFKNSWNMFVPWSNHDAKPCMADFMGNLDQMGPSATLTKTITTILQIDINEVESKSNIYKSSIHGDAKLCCRCDVTEARVWGKG